MIGTDGASVYEREQVVADWAGVLGNALHPDHGGFHANPLVIVLETGADGKPTIAQQGLPEPRNWHFWEDDKDLPGSAIPGLRDRRVSLALISDYEHKFSGFQLGPLPMTNIFDDDWLDENHSTRIIDYTDPKGRAALFSQLAKVVDSWNGEFVPCLPHGPMIAGQFTLLPPPDDPDAPTSVVGGPSEVGVSASVDARGAQGGAGQAASFGWWDGRRAGYTSTFMAPIHVDDVDDGGILATDWGVQGFRIVTHFEWGEKHGGLMFSKTNLIAEEGDGPIFVAELRHDPTVKLQPGIGGETGKWRPYYRMPYHRQENGITRTPFDGSMIPGGRPGGPGDPTGHPGDSLPGNPVPGFGERGVIVPIPVDDEGWFDHFGPTATPTSMTIVLPGLTPGGGLLTAPIISSNYNHVDQQAYMGALTGTGIAGDKTTWYSLQGPVGFEEWGFTLGSPVQIGPNAADTPTLRWGDTGEDNWTYELNPFDGNLELHVRDLLGLPVTTQQTEYFTSVHLQGPETGDTSRSWNTQDESSGGGYGQIAVLDSDPIVLFARQDWYQDLSGAAHDGPIAHFARTKESDLFGVRYHANIDAPQHTELDPVTITPPVAGDDVFFYDATNDGHATRMDSDGVLHDLEMGGGGSGGQVDLSKLQANQDFMLATMRYLHQQRAMLAL